MRWRILPIARQAQKNRVMAILARNSGTYQPVAIVRYADLVQLLGVRADDQLAARQNPMGQNPVVH